MSKHQEVKYTNLANDCLILLCRRLATQKSCPLMNASNGLHPAEIQYDDRDAEPRDGIDQCTKLAALIDRHTHHFAPCREMRVDFISVRSIEPNPMMFCLELPLYPLHRLCDSIFSPNALS